MSEKTGMTMGRGLGPGFTGGDHFSMMMPLVCIVFPALGSAFLGKADAHSRPFWAAGIVVMVVVSCLGKKSPRFRAILLLTAGALFLTALAVALAAAEGM